jgi:hypothetical protein
MNLKRKRAEIRFTDPQEINKHLICSICQDVFDDPRHIACGFIKFLFFSSKISLKKAILFVSSASNNGSNKAERLFVRFVEPM